MARKSALTMTKPELAQAKAMNDLGLTPHSIGHRLHRDPKTIAKWLKSEVYQTDSEIGAMVEIIKAKEIDDLYLLGAKSRARLHELLDEGKMRPIEAVATLDRSFQQRRVLEGSSTENVFVVHKTIEDLRAIKGPAEANLEDIET